MSEESLSFHNHTIPIQAIAYQKAYEMINELGEIILDRDFESIDNEGNSGIIKLRLGKPFINSTSTTSLKWRCHFQITGIGLERIKEVTGLDALDALFHALFIAELYLKSCSENYHKKIMWLHREDWGLHSPSLTEIQDSSNNIFKSDESRFQKEFDDFFRDIDAKTDSDKPESNE